MTEISVNPKDKWTLYYGRIVRAENMKNSLSGNPRYKIFVQCYPDDGILREFWTRFDADYNFKVHDYVASKQWVEVYIKSKSNIVEAIEADDKGPEYMDYDTTYGGMDSTQLEVPLRDQIVNILESLTVDNRHQLVEATHNTADNILHQLFERGLIIKRL